MRRKFPIFYSALMLTGVNLLLRLGGTAFQVFLSRQIGAAGIGLSQLVLSVGSLSVTAGMAGVRTATMYLTAGELGRGKPGNVRWVLSGCLLYSILCSGFVCLLLQFFAPQLAAGWIGDPRTAGAIRLYGSFIPLFCLCGVMTGYFTAANRIGTLAAVEVAEQLCTVAITMLLLLRWAGADPVRACQSIIFGNGCGAVLTLACLSFLRLRQRVAPLPRIPVRRSILNTAVPLALADDLKAGINTAENLMVPKRLSLYGGAAAPLAAFGTVCGMVFPVVMFPAAILFALAELLIPELARCAAAGSHHRVRYLVKRGLKVALLYGCLVGGLEFLLARKLCLQLYKNHEAGEYLRLYALLIPMLYCDLLTDAMTKGLGQQKACVRYNILTSAMDLALLFLLLPRYGMIGYFFSFFVTHLINFVLSLRRLLRIAGKAIRLSTIVSALIATAAGLLAASLCPPWAQSIVFSCCLICLLTLLGVLGKEDLAWVKGLVKK